MLIEAAACGKCAIASDVPGCNYIISDRVSGFLVKNVRAESIFEAMHEYSKLSNAQRISYSKEASKRALTLFDEKIVISHYQKLVSIKEES